MMSSATSSCWRNPKATAQGMNTSESPTVLIKAAARVGPALRMALAPLKPAPMDSSASGVVSEERLVSVFSAMAGICTGSRLNTVPATIPSRIGLVRTPRSTRAGRGV